MNSLKIENNYILFKYLLDNYSSAYMFFSFHCYSSAESEDLAVHLYPGAVTIQGVLRRKTLLKEGKKPTVRIILYFKTCLKISN